MLQRAYVNKRPFHIAGFVCPLYEMDENLLDKGFGEAIIGIGEGSIDEYSRYKEKIDRLLRTLESIHQTISPYIPVEIDFLMGDKGIINVNQIAQHQDIAQSISCNIESYRSYIESQGVQIGKYQLGCISDYTSHLPEIGKPSSDLHADGSLYFANKDSFPLNERVDRIITHELLHRRGGRGEQKQFYEPLGFALNYGVAGVALRQHDVDMIIGIDKPGSYLNHLYHTFLNPEDLYMEVAV